jgi:hypothetical protein
MIGVPQLRGDKEFFTRDPLSSEPSLQGLAHLTLISVSFRTIEVSKSSFQRVSGRGYRRGCVGNQGAKAEYGYMAGAVAERYSFRSKIRRIDHEDL